MLRKLGRFDVQLQLAHARELELELELDALRSSMSQWSACERCGAGFTRERAHECEPARLLEIIEELENELDESRLDTDRVDWLDEMAKSTLGDASQFEAFLELMSRQTPLVGSFENVREVIDALRTASEVIDG